MIIGFSSDGNFKETVALAALQFKLPGSQIDLDKQEIQVGSNEKCAAEIMEIIKSIPGMGVVHWKE